MSGGATGLWDEALPYFAERAYAHLDAQPESLLLQSGYATLTLGGEYAPKDVDPGPPWCQFTVLFLRYRRRL